MITCNKPVETSEYWAEVTSRVNAMHAAQDAYAADPNDETRDDMRRAQQAMCDYVNDTVFTLFLE